MQMLIIVLVLVALTLALIGTTTNYWYQSLSNEYHEGLWVICRRQSASNLSSSSSAKAHLCQDQPFFKSQFLSVGALVLLSLALILSIIKRYRKNDYRLIYLSIVLLVVSTLLLIFSYLLYPRDVQLQQLGYSIYFMLISSLFTFISTGLVTFTLRTIQLT